jgi:hypothetical protein
MTNRGVTPTYALPYPGDSDIPDVPKDLASLAGTVDAAMAKAIKDAITSAKNTAVAADKALASGVWGQLGLAKFGAGSNGSYGQETYFDTGGHLRSKPIIIEGGKFKNSASPGSYPRGLTLMGISGADATAGGWPDGSSCFVLTMMRAGDADANAVGGQLWFVNTATYGNYKVRYRGAAGNWGAWIDIVDDGMQTTVDSGQYTFNMTTTNQSLSRAITFAAGRFSTTPNTFCNPQTSDPSAVSVSAGSESAHGFTIYFHRTNNVDTGVRWTAIQKNS